MNSQKSSHFLADMYRQGRRDFRNSQLSLEGADLSNMNLEGSDFSGVNLSQADFSGTNLSYTKFNDANLSFSKFDRSVLTQVDFRYSNLSGADLSIGLVHFCLFDKAIVLGCNFKSTQLLTSTFTDTYYDGCTHFPADFNPNAKTLKVAGVRKVIQRMYARGKRRFEQSDVLLADADLSALNLEGCNFVDIDLSNVNFSHSNLTGASFSRVNLSFANFSNCVLMRAAFKDSDLKFACLSESDIRFAIFDRSNLSGCKFQDSQLSPSIFVGFYYDKNTAFPESFAELDKGELVDEGFTLKTLSSVYGNQRQKAEYLKESFFVNGSLPAIPQESLISNVHERATGSQGVSRHQQLHGLSDSDRGVDNKLAQQRPAILCVDDSPIVRTMLKRALVDRYKVHLACNGIEALAILKKCDISLVLLDVTMPDIDGYEVCRTIRRIDRFKELPVVMITAKDSVFDRVKGKLSGTDRYLTKPIDTDKVISVVEEFTSKACVVR